MDGNTTHYVENMDNILYRSTSYNLTDIGSGKEIVWILYYIQNTKK